jgi:hypothetical protein
VELSEVIVHEHSRAFTFHSRTYDEALTIAGQIVEQPVVIGFAIHDVYDALVGDSLRRE